MSRISQGSYHGDASKLGDDSQLECGVCWWVYDPAAGDEVAQVAAGTPFALLPDTWRCPNCDAEKQKFMVVAGHERDPNESAAPVTRVVAMYQRAALSMKGLPIYNPVLSVEAVGFREHEGRHVGVIVTPWFMNLLVVPSEQDLANWVAGETARLAFPSGLYDFLVSEAEDSALIATCSLFSPMDQFADHEAARIAAQAAADALFEQEAPAPEPVISRRKLLGG